MRTKPAGLVAVMLVLTTALAACAKNLDQAADGGPLARQVTATSQCGFAEPGLVYMASHERLQEVTSTQGLNLTSMEDHDFSEEPLLLVAAGRKPTGGYGVALDDARIRDGVLEVTVTLNSPSADEMVTQALTSPCAVMAVTGSGWHRLTVDGPGLPRLSLER